MKSLLALAALLVVASAPTLAAPPAGNWKFRTVLPTQEGPAELTLLLAFTETDGKWFGDYLDASMQLRVAPKITGVVVTADAMKFVIEFNKGEPAFEFEGVLAKEGKKISGSLSKFRGPLEVGEIYPSKLKKLSDDFEVAREDFAQIEGGQPLFTAGFTMLKVAAEKKLPVDEVRSVVERLTKAATTYGSRWERTTALKIADLLAGQEGMSDVAIAQARRAERMLAEDAPALLQLSVLETVSRVLTRCGKEAEAKKYEVDIAKLEAQDLAAFAKETVSFDTPAFAGRKGKSERVTLVEVFTGAECPPCVAVDAAFDGVLKTFKPTDVVLLQYHIHVPGPDPLTNDDTINRALNLFGDKITAPRLFINGKESLRGGGPLALGKTKYTDLRAALEKELENPATAKLALTVAKADKGIAVKAAVSDLAKPGEKVALRFAVVEPMVRFVGGNGIRFHQNVVRAMPGGPKGFPLLKATHEQTINVNADEIRSGLTKYLDTFAKEFAPFPSPDRPMRLKNLKVVAFIQDDATGEVLAASQIDLDGK